MVVLAFSISTWEVVNSRSAGLHSKFQITQGYISETLSFKKVEKKCMT